MMRDFRSSVMAALFAAKNFSGAGHQLGAEGYWEELDRAALFRKPEAVRYRGHGE